MYYTQNGGIMTGFTIQNPKKDGIKNDFSFRFLEYKSSKKYRMILKNLEFVDKNNDNYPDKFHDFYNDELKLKNLNNILIENNRQIVRLM